MLAQRQERGLLGGMWEFPNTQVTHIQATQKESLARVVPDAIQQCCQLQVEVEQAIGVFRHAYTHFKVTLHAYRCALLTERSDLQQAPSQKWVALSELPDYPMGKLSRQVARALVAQH
ncbi:MAG: NUDIX domain-containing protein [Coleofasciculaceae cyanobacterium SM2_3_26]|nr:NUDIX domain-containing protein [Coleofasciculaceae cyanobacterium SM2_3_26]